MSSPTQPPGPTPPEASPTAPEASPAAGPPSPPGAPHPAIPLIRHAETTPALPFSGGAVSELCAVASQLAPESLPPAWIFRLALRFAEVLWNEKAFERADIWLGIAHRHAHAVPALAAAEVPVLTARVAVRRTPPTPLGTEAAFAPAVAQAHAAAAAVLEPEGPESPAESATDTPARQRGRAGLRSRLALLDAEAALAQGDSAPAIEALTPLLARPGALGRIDDLWRAQRLLAFGHQSRLDFARAAPLYAANAQLALDADAPLDAAEALLAQAQCLVGLGAVDAARQALAQASALAPADSLPFRAVAGAAALLALAEGRPGEALARARAAAVDAAQADDHRGYLDLVALVVSLHRLTGAHETAYREVLSIYSQLTHRLGPQAAAPLQAQLDLLQQDLGPEAFEALSAKILAEHTPG